MSRLSLDKFKDFWRWWNNGIKQNEALEALYTAMPVSLLEEDSTWIDLFRTPDPVPKSVIPKQCLDIIAEFEGFRPTPYLCPAGVATIGYGNTFYEDGRSVTMNDGAITEPQAKRMLSRIVEEDFWDVLAITVPFWDELSDNQRSALTSFAFNLGARFYAAPGFATISACLREHAWDEVPGALMLYKNPGSPFEEGLRRRREAEGKLWMT